MAATLEELQVSIKAAAEPGYRDQLLAQGQARAMIWRNGELPIDAEEYDPRLSEDLLNFGYSLLLHGLRYLDLGGDFETAQADESAVAPQPAAFERAGRSADADPAEVRCGAEIH